MRKQSLLYFERRCRTARQRARDRYRRVFGQAGESVRVAAVAENRDHEILVAGPRHAQGPLRISRRGLQTTPDKTRRVALVCGESLKVDRGIRDRLTANLGRGVSEQQRQVGRREVGAVGDTQSDTGVLTSSRCEYIGGRSVAPVVPTHVRIVRAVAPGNGRTSRDDGAASPDWARLDSLRAASRASRGRRGTAGTTAPA